MNPSFFKTLLNENPELLKQIFVFNRSEEKADSGSCETEDSLGAALLRHPELVRAISSKSNVRERAKAGYWNFVKATERTALLPRSELERLGRLAAAALLGERIVRVVQRPRVMALRALLGEDVYRYALRRGRFQSGSISSVLDALPLPEKPEEALPRLARILLEILRSGWSDELARRTREDFQALSFPALTIEEERAFRELTPEELIGIRHFLLKLILLELDPKWKTVFA